MGRIRFRLSFIISRALLAGFRRAYRNRPSSTSIRCTSLNTRMTTGGPDEVASFIVSTAALVPKHQKKQKKHRTPIVGFGYTCCREDGVVLATMPLRTENNIQEEAFNENIQEQVFKFNNDNFQEQVYKSMNDDIQDQVPKFNIQEQVSVKNDIPTMAVEKSTRGVIFVEESELLDGPVDGRRAPVNSDVSGLLAAPPKPRKQRNINKSRSSSSNSRVLCSGSSSFCMSSSSTASSGGELDDEEPLFGSDFDTNSSRQNNWEQFTTDVDSLYSSSSSNRRFRHRAGKVEAKNNWNSSKMWEADESRTKMWDFEERRLSSSGSGGSRKRKTKRRMKLGCVDSPQIRNSSVKGGVPVMMLSSDPYEDFRQSMVHMISDKGLSRIDELENLLECYLRLNSSAFHGLILQVFSDLVRP